MRLLKLMPGGAESAHGCRGCKRRNAPRGTGTRSESGSEPGSQHGGKKQNKRRLDLVLATGHSSSEECLMLIREAKRQGVRHMVVTLAMIAPIHMKIPQMREAAEMGAYIEFVYNGLIGPYKEFDFADYAKAIRAVGVESCILASDLAQVVNPVQPDGLNVYFAGLR